MLPRFFIRHLGLLGNHQLPMNRFPQDRDDKHHPLLGLGIPAPVGFLTLDLYFCTRRWRASSRKRVSSPECAVLARKNRPYRPRRWHSLLAPNAAPAASFEESIFPWNGYRLASAPAHSKSWRVVDAQVDFTVG